MSSLWRVEFKCSSMRAGRYRKAWREEQQLGDEVSAPFRES